MINIKTKSREEIVDDIANITDKHGSAEGFYRINCGAEIYSYIQKLVEAERTELRNKVIEEVTEKVGRHDYDVDGNHTVIKVIELRKYLNSLKTK